MRYVILGIIVLTVVAAALLRDQPNKDCLVEMHRLSFEFDNIADQLDERQDIPQTVALLRYHADRLRNPQFESFRLKEER
jgi:hypothetical protein